MLPNFLVEETIVRESGQGAVFDLTNYSNQNLLVTLGITHAVERESIGVDIHGSDDGRTWPAKPLVRFTPKSYCGTYDLMVPACGAGYLKAVWSVKRWSRDEAQPFFRIFVSVKEARVRTMTASAA